MQVMSNYVAIRSRPHTAMYQYHIDYSPRMESKRLRIALLLSQEGIVGKKHAFDGAILNLPFRLDDDVTKIQTRTKNGEDVTRVGQHTYYHDKYIHDNIIVSILTYRDNHANDNTVNNTSTQPLCAVYEL